jgi:hypothetical protein
LARIVLFQDFDQVGDLGCENMMLLDVECGRPESSHRYAGEPVQQCPNIKVRYRVRNGRANDRATTMANGGYWPIAARCGRPKPTCFVTDLSARDRTRFSPMDLHC